MHRNEIAMVVVMVGLLGAVAQAYDPGTHVYLASETFNVWANYDRDFYDSLMLPETSPNGFEVRKFYYIGATLPDLLMPTVMDTVGALLRLLHTFRDTAVWEWYGGAGVSLLGPLSITDTTDTNVAVSIIYHTGESEMNSNFPKVSQMVQYVRARGWTPKYKALVYGCYIHMIQDLYEGMALLPSRFGYGYALDSDSAASLNILSFGETYYEILAGTHIDTSDCACFEKGLFGAVRHENGSVASMGGYLDFHPFLQYYDETGRHGFEQVHGWQQIDFPYVDSFVQAMDACFEVDNLTRERLESYMHGWAILLFMAYGHERDQGLFKNKNIGGVMSHPDWTPSEIAGFWINVGDDFFQLNVTPAWFIDAFGYLLGNVPYALAREYVIGWFESILPRALLPYSMLGLPDPQLGWTEYLETAEGIGTVWEAIPESLKSPAACTLEARLVRNTGIWDDHSIITKPNERSSYAGEVTYATTHLGNLYYRALVGGSDTIGLMMDGIYALPLAAKAGLTGGMFEPPDASYSRQPGVFYAGFEENGNRVWAPLSVYSHGDTQRVALQYDLTGFGGTRLSVKAKCAAGYATMASRVHEPSYGPEHWKDSLVTFGPELQSAGACTLWFDIETENVNRQFATMLSSKYDAAYNADAAISDNVLYQRTYNNGDPTRIARQDPFAHPDSFWPYALLLNPVDGYHLNPPSGLTAQRSNSRLAVELDWVDSSSYEYGYKIEKTVNSSSPTYIPTQGLLDSNTTHYEDVDVAFGDTYRYRVWCERDQWKSDTTPYAEIVVTVLADFPPTAYNNQNKVVVDGSEVHFTYNTGSNGVMYVHSTDGGKTWEAPERAYAEEAGPGSPAIALNSVGEPCILYPGVWTQDPGKPHQLPYRVSWKNNGRWDCNTAFVISSDPNLSAPPPMELPVASFCMRGDTWFAALDYLGYDSLIPENPGTYYATNVLAPHWTLGGSCGVLDSIAPKSTFSLPTVLVDASGRRLVVSTYGDGDTVIRISYMDAGQDTFSNQEYKWREGVYNITAALERDTNLLLAWVGSGFELDFARFVKGTPGYTPDPAEIVPDLVDWQHTRPRFVAGPSNLPMLMYEHDPSPQRADVWYATRVAPGSWIADTILTSDYLLGYPQGFRAGSRLGVFASGSEELCVPPYYLVSGTLDLPWYQFLPTSNSLATWPNSGRKLVRHSEDDGVHVVYSTGDSVLYAASQDDGETWGDATPIDCGDYPSLALDAAGLPTIVYLRNDTVFAKTMRTDSSWYEMTLYLGSSALPPGTPAVDRLQAPIPSSYPYCAFPSYNQSTRSTKIGLVKLDTLGVTTAWVAESTVIPMDSFVSVACSPDGPVCVAWQRANRVMCATFTSGGMPSYVQVADSAIHPFIYVYGDYFYLVWRQVPTGQVCMSSRLIAGGTWSSVSVVASSGDYPVHSKASTAGWQEWDLCRANDVWAKACTLAYNLSESENVSSEYPHMDVSVAGTDSTPIINAIYGVWTESVSDSLYSVRFRKLELQASSNSLRRVPPSHSLVCGQEAASTSCLSRSGRDSSAGAWFDYGSDSLSYLIRYINPSYNYLAEFSVAPDQQLASEQSVRVRGREVARLQFGPGRPTTARLVLPRWCYENGTTLPLSLEGVLGERVTLSGLKLYAFDSHRLQAEGVMSTTSPIVSKPLLSSCRPNPFKSRTQISYALPTAGKVSLRVYDVTGRTVRTLESGHKKAGSYSVIWDAKDSRGKQVPYGVYFYRLDTPGFRSVKKAVVTR